MTVFPALNITGIARVELSARVSLRDLEYEAQRIFIAIRTARNAIYAPMPQQANVCDGHKVLFRMVGHVNAPTVTSICCYRRDIEDYFPKEGARND